MVTREELEQVARDAAAEGARLVLKDLGVPSDELELIKFRADIHEVRGLLDAYRTAKRTVWMTVLKWGTTITLAAIGVSVVHDRFR